MPKVYLLLGSNLGDRQNLLAEARKQIGLQIGLIQKTSALYETAAWGVEDQEAFLNQVLEVETVLPPEALLTRNQEIEKGLGRIRKERWGARLLDIDILFYDDLILESDNLTIPHPQLHNRRFTLVPLAEIASGLVHPVFKKTVSALLEFCPDKLEVKKFGDL